MQMLQLFIRYARKPDRYENVLWGTLTSGDLSQVHRMICRNMLTLSML